VALTVEDGAIEQRRGLGQGDGCDRDAAGGRICGRFCKPR
jgi:hypothetical protein